MGFSSLLLGVAQVVAETELQLERGPEAEQQSPPEMSFLVSMLTVTVSPVDSALDTAMMPSESWSLSLTARFDDTDGSTVVVGMCMLESELTGTGQLRAVGLQLMWHGGADASCFVPRQQGNMLSWMQGGNVCNGRFLWVYCILCCATVQYRFCPAEGEAGNWVVVTTVLYDLDQPAVNQHRSPR